MNYVFHPEALAEYAEAVQYYAQRAESSTRLPALYLIFHCT